MPANPRDPKTPEQWQEAVDAAEAILLLDSARKYGLVTGGPIILVDRCDEILSRGRAMNVHPNRVAVDRWIREMTR